MKLKSLREAPIKRKSKVILRIDFNVELKNGRVLDDFRIQEALPTIKFILKRGGYLRIISHLGRPGGKSVPSLSVRPLRDRLQEVLRQEILMVQDPFDEAQFDKLNNSPEILFFENVRFWPGEEKNDPLFARKLSFWGDLYVNEAFSNSHRFHASIVSLPNFLPSFAGLRLEREIRYLESLFKRPRRPFIAVLGGAKTSTKMHLIRRFLKEADRLIVGGAIANTILAFRGIKVGRSAYENLKGKKVYKKIFYHKKIYLPVDVVTVSSMSLNKSVMRVKKIGALGERDRIVDAGPRTVKLFINLLKDAKTVVWNGPLGLTGYTRFEKGTRILASFVSGMEALRVVGGGETVAVLRKYKLVDGFNHVSTGGGAMLEFLAGKKLPGIEALKKSKV